MSRLSPAQRHLQRHFAAKSIKDATPALRAAARPEVGPEASAYALLRAQLGEDRNYLRDIQSNELKVAAKRDMLPAYDDHIDTVLLTSMETGSAVQDEIFVRLMIWHFDCGLFDRALDMADHVLKFDLVMPDNFRRTPAVVVAEMVAEAALDALTLKQPFDLTVLHRTAALVAGHDVVDIVSAKLHKAFGLLYLRIAAEAAEDPTGPAGAVRAAHEHGLTHLTKALALDRNIGVKEAIKTTERLLKKAPPEQTT